MATFTWIPSFSSSESSQPRVLKTALGDGAEQRIRMGLNSDPKTWDLQFNNRDDAERDQIRTFLEARAGVEAFNWTTPWNQTGRSWVCEEWNIDPTNCNNNQIRAKFRQVYESVPPDPTYSNIVTSAGLRLVTSSGDYIVARS
jgi:phage-related protein